MTPDDPRHGTSAGYIAGCRCDDCGAAKLAYNKGLRWQRHTTGKGRKTDPTGILRRIQALACLGWSVAALARRSGMHHQVLHAAGKYYPTVYLSTARKVAALYDDLSMTPAPETTHGERLSAAKARAHAARRGYAPPLAWEGVDIDDPAARPDVGRERNNWRAADLAAEWDHLRRAGVSIEEAAARLGVTVGGIERALERARKEVA